MKWFESFEKHQVGITVAATIVAVIVAVYFGVVH